MISSKKTVLKITAARTDEPIRVELFAENKISVAEWTITDGERVMNSGKLSGINSESAEIFASFEAEEWSLDFPKLYSLSVDLLYENGEREALTDKFGFRRIVADGKYIYLNDFPFYMRGYIRGCAAHEHANNCKLDEYDFYKKNILTAKSYGYNTIRFHSVIPPEACFRAADDLGILIHIEMRREKKEYNNLHEMLYGKNDFVTNEELIEIINTLYNHPSFMVYCIGNEIRQPGQKPRVREIRDFIKKHDPTRLFIDTCAHGEYDRDYVDFDVQHMSYFFPYGKHSDMFSNTDNLLGFGTVRNIDMVAENESGKIRRGISFSRPLIAHEICHYTSWRDFYALKEKFARYGVEAPWWVDEEIKMIEAKGYKEGFRDTLQITKDFQFRCWKTALESLRSSELLSGFHMLQFADTDKYENSNGVVDCFDDPHGISAEEFLKFNSDTVLLARLPKQVFFSGERVAVPVLLSQYKIAPPVTADFSYTLSKNNEICRTGTLKALDTGKSGLYTLCKLEFALPELDSAQKYVLTCRLDFADGSSVENSWELWSFPKCEYPIRLAARCDMKEDYLKSVCAFDPDADVILTDKLDDGLFERLNNGETVVLLYRTDWTRHLLHKGMAAPKYSFRHTWDRFKGVIWDRGTINGGPDRKDILNKYGFVTDGQINFQYYSLIDDSDKINLDDFPVSVNSLVSGLDKSSRDRFDPKKFGLPELMYDRTMRRFSYAFSLKVGAGRLVVCGFNLTHVAERCPASIAMLKALVAYAASSDFSGGEISAEALADYLAAVAAEGPQKERMMTQYWQLDDEPVESMDYWNESERYLKED